MTVLFGTLGFTPAKFLGAVKTVPDISEVVFFTAHTDRPRDRARSEGAVAEVERTLKCLDIPHRHVELAHPFDFAEFLTQFLGELQKAGPTNVVFNLTGGTKPMALAATVACMVLGVRAYYVPEEQEGAQALQLPIFRIRYSRVLTPKAYRVLQELKRSEPQSLGELAGTLDIQRSTLSGHIRNLEQLGAVRLVPIPGRGAGRRPELTEAGTLLLVVEALAEPP